MDEKNTIRKYKILLIVVSVLLIAVLCVQAVYWAGRHGKTTDGAGTARSEAEQSTAAQPAGEEQAVRPEAEQQAGEQQTAQPEAEQQAGEQQTAQPEAEQQAGEAAQEPVSDRGSLSREGYTLEQVVVMSRHNIRSPLSGKGSVLDTMTPHQWFAWSSAPGELSLRGGAMETIMGQYFRKWLENDGLFPANYHPGEGAVRFYSNSRQRTIATAEFFMSGLLPTANMNLEYKVQFETTDPVFNPQLTFVTDAYTDDVLAQIDELYGEKIRNLEDNFELIEDVIDFKESDAYKSGENTGLSTDDITYKFEEYAEPGMVGALKTACSISDALVLQYYEEKDPVKAAFGHELTWEQWKEISEIKDIYGDVLFRTPLLSYNVAHPLLKEIRSELTADDREFSFLCGHDSNIASLLTCLRVSTYTLPGSIETVTPIGGKIVFGRWRGPGGEELISVDFVYSSSEQLRTLSLLDLENPPYVVPLELEGLEQISDGLYKAEDVLGRIDETIAEYDKMLVKYGVQAEQETQEQETQEQETQEQEQEIQEQEPEEEELDEAA